MNLASFDGESLTGDRLQLLRESQPLIEQISTEIRTISHLCHPPLPDEAGLGAALRIYVECFSQRSKIVADLQIPEDLPHLSRDLEISIFRIVQECLTNIHKHAEAGSVAIAVSRCPEGVTLRLWMTGKPCPMATVLVLGSGEWNSVCGNFAALSKSAPIPTVGVTLPAMLTGGAGQAVAEL